MNTEWVSVKEASKMLGVHEDTVRNWVDSEKLKAYITSGGHRRIHKESVKDYVSLTPKKRKAVPGARFGKLTFIRRGTTKRVQPHNPNGGYYFWLCRCDCGVEREFNAHNVRSGSVRSCGCIRQRKNLLNEEAGLRRLYGFYKKNAAESGREFSLTLEDVKEITKRPCFYCGCSPSNSVVTRIKNPVPYVYNGMDRVDNSMGYTLSNVVPCCKECNYMKRTSTVEEFKAHISKIYHFLINKADTPQG